MSSLAKHIRHFLRRLREMDVSPLIQSLEGQDAPLPRVAPILHRLVEHRRILQLTLHHRVSPRPTLRLIATQIGFDFLSPILTFFGSGSALVKRSRLGLSSSRSNKRHPAV